MIRLLSSHLSAVDKHSNATYVQQQSHAATTSEGSHALAELSKCTLAAGVESRSLAKVCLAALLRCLGSLDLKLLSSALVPR